MTLILHSNNSSSAFSSSTSHVREHEELSRNMSEENRYNDDMFHNGKQSFQSNGKQHTSESTNEDHSTLGNDAEGGSKDVKEDTKILLDLFLRKQLKSRRDYDLSQSYNFGSTDGDTTASPSVKRNNSEPHAKFYGVQSTQPRPDGTSRFERRSSIDLRRNASAPHTSSSSTLDSLDNTISPEKSAKSSVSKLKKRRTNSFIRAQRSPVLSHYEPHPPPPQPQRAEETTSNERVLGRRRLSSGQSFEILDVPGVRRIQRSIDITTTHTNRPQEIPPLPLHTRGGSEPSKGFNQLYEPSSRPSTADTATPSPRKEEKRLFGLFKKGSKSQHKFIAETSSHPHIPPDKITSHQPADHPSSRITDSAIRSHDISDSGRYDASASSSHSTNAKCTPTSESKWTPKLFRKISQKKTKSSEPKSTSSDVGRSKSTPVANYASDMTNEDEKSRSLPHDMKYTTTVAQPVIKPKMSERKKDEVENLRKMKRKVRGPSKDKAKRPLQLNLGEKKKKGFKSRMKKFFGGSSSSSEDEGETTRPSMTVTSTQGRRPPPPTPATSGIQKEPKSFTEVRASTEDSNHTKLTSSTSTASDKNKEHRRSYHHRASRSVNDLDRNTEFYEQIVERLKRIAEEVIKSPHGHNESEEENISSPALQTTSGHHYHSESYGLPRKSSEPGALNTYFRMKDHQQKNKARAPHAHRTRYPRGAAGPPKPSMHSPGTTNTHLHFKDSGIATGSLDSPLQTTGGNDLRNWARRVSQELNEHKEHKMSAGAREGLRLLGTASQVEHQEPKFDFHGDMNYTFTDSVDNDHVHRGNICVNVHADAVPITSQSSSSEDDEGIAGISPPPAPASTRPKKKHSAKKKDDHNHEVLVTTEYDINVTETVEPEPPNSRARLSSHDHPTTSHTHSHANGLNRFSSIESDLDAVDAMGAVGGVDIATATDQRPEDIEMEELIDKLANLIKNKGDEYTKTLPEGINDDIVRMVGRMGTEEFRSFANRIVRQVIQTSHRGPCRHDEILQLSIIFQFTELFHSVATSSSGWVDTIKKRALSLIEPFVENFGSWHNLNERLVETERHLTANHDESHERRRREGSNVDGENSSSGTNNELDEVE